jgi:WD40 repeat protein
MISQSVPHIYMSALPFAPATSEVSRQFLPYFPRTLSAERGRANAWPAIQYVLEGHSDSVHSVAFSQDGKRIASGSYDNTIRVWDAETGDVVSGPFEGHSGFVNSVAFSHDGKRIVSGSYDETIRVWDAETGDVVSGPFEGHSGSVSSVAFSQDGKRIVSGSDDMTIRVWDVGDFEAPGSSKGFASPSYIPTTGFVDRSKLVNGWILGSVSELLFWVPPWNRKGLFWPRNTAVIADGLTKVNLGRFVHGTSWQQCYAPRQFQ